MTANRLGILGALLLEVAACSGGSLTKASPHSDAGPGTGGHAAGGPGMGGAAPTGMGGGTTRVDAGGVDANGPTGAGGSTGACVPLPPVPRRVLALQPAQFGNAVRDLLALPAPVRPIAGSTPALPNAADVSIDSSYLYALYVAAGMAVSQAAPRAAALAACAAGETDADCAGRFARDFGRKAFRRALDEVEVSDILQVFATVCPGPSPSCASAADFSAAIALMTKAFILAPSFLYRTELGPRSLTANAAGVFPDTTLTPDEVATQLGFLLLGSTPDAGLLAAADSGALATPAGIASEVARLLALPAAQANVSDLVTRWLGVDQIASATNKDPSLLAPLPAADQDQALLTTELRASWDRTVTATLWSKPTAKVTDLLTFQTFFVDWLLSGLYGVPASSMPGTLTEGPWPATQPRAGILTHPAFLWTLSDPRNTRIVRRGQVVHDAIVCQDPVALEPELTSAEARAVLSTGDSEATRSDARLASGKLCADGCHSELDPYGRILQAFDAIGNFRQVDEAGRPVDSTATLTASSPLGAMTVPGPVAFSQALVDSGVFAGCAVQRLFEAVVATRVNQRNSCQLEDLRAAFDRSDGTMTSLLTELSSSDFARARAGGPP
ncbi:MAG TPA: DUF1592 domain-containing protein [Polyangia bacterium]|nr:DUF1592 domain-containing protein [Polyangia bacterium]